ncbi:tRNA (adenosine(37)-N6)-dimethylallyltransferase MiaA [Paramaledivibacter caminithermalis]|uniref:tRNA dimethylallyltransferase n=1 Tax=Paramaledivibacter caminithermalis (strain DSM 15212 / CIP 107654 / DViRD3) TaxID=1121301 RepID=A0A1M6JKT7_PARC5|nr:tRNA (adenosine(37)-N6)-dimethylallyltransferase MiaA [Paramaledivibacter caminithermalis]SHJ47299.1 tRNA dimethylallyltransferase [Paramaledivibacter caminithermalis DSM 15212]
MKKPLVIIAGPTAVGKTEISIEAAKRLNGEIVSADSMQIYKYLNIGSAKPTKEEMEGIPHYLIDEIDPRTDFSVSEYRNLAKNYIDKILLKKKLPIVAGGTGLYVNSLIYDMDFSNTKSDKAIRQRLTREYELYGGEYLHDKLKEVDRRAAERIHSNNVKRVIRALEVFYTTGESIKDFSKDLVQSKDYDYILIGLNRDRHELYERINKRVDIMFDNGLLAEVKNLVEMGLTIQDISMKGIGYKEIIGYLNGEYDLSRAIELVKRNTRRYAKRQLTWFKRYQNMKWFNLNEDKEKIINNIIGFIEGNIKFL